MKSIEYLNRLLASKKDSLNNRIDNLKQFKITNRVLNLNEQAKSMYTIMSDFETRIELTRKDIEENEGALKSIDAKFNENDRKYVDSKLTLINQEILTTRQQLNSLNDAYIKSNFNNIYKEKMDSLSVVLSQKINQGTDKFILNPLAAKENLVNEKLKLEIGLDIAKNSMKTLQNELVNINQRFDKLVPNEAVIQAFEGDIHVADQEYVEILKKFNETSLELNASVKLKVIESAAPGTKQPSKKYERFCELRTLPFCIVCAVLLRQVH
jgi:succinoglycan biosynthesis transport protein ExoP